MGLLRLVPQGQVALPAVGLLSDRAVHHRRRFGGRAARFRVRGPRVWCTERRPRPLSVISCRCRRFDHRDRFGALAVRIQSGLCFGDSRDQSGAYQRSNSVMFRGPTSGSRNRPSSRSLNNIIDSLGRLRGLRFNSWVCVRIERFVCVLFGFRVGGRVRLRRRGHLRLTTGLPGDSRGALLIIGRERLADCGQSGLRGRTVGGRVQIGIFRGSRGREEVLQGGRGAVAIAL